MVARAPCGPKAVSASAAAPIPSPDRTTRPMTELAQAVDTVIAQCLAVKAHEDVVVIADTAAALRAADVFIAPTSSSLSHTRARKAATDNGARGATLPGVTEDMHARLMACDFETLQRRSRALAALLTEANEARFTCPRGSDLRLDLTGREGIPDNGDLTGDRAFGNLPCGEGSSPPGPARARWSRACWRPSARPTSPRRSPSKPDASRPRPAQPASASSPTSAAPATTEPTSRSSASAPTSAPPSPLE